MAEIKLTDQLTFPESKVVKAYPASNWPTPMLPSGAPVGSATAEATVTNGDLTFTGLTANTDYWLVAEVAGKYRYVKISTSEASSSAVSVSGEPTVKLAAGTNAVGKLSANSGVDIGDVDVTSLPNEKAHDAADAGNPVKIGGRARTTHTAAVANDDRSDITLDKYGRLLIADGIPDTLVKGIVTLTDTTSTTVLEAPGENIRLLVVAMKVINGHETQGTKVEVLDEATKVDLGYAGVKGGGWITPAGFKLLVTANKPLKVKCLSSGASVDVSATAYKLPV